MKELVLEFRGVDDWSRPIYKVQGQKLYIGSTDVLIPDNRIGVQNSEAEINAYFRENLNQLTIFGSSFNCEPYGAKINKSFTIKIIDPS